MDSVTSAQPAAATTSLGWFGRYGSSSDDSDDLRLKKSLLVLTVVLILPISLIWGSLYLVFGSPVGFVPFIYFVIAVLGLVIFGRTHDFDSFLVIELLDIMLAPTLSAIPLGGFPGSSGVGIWGLLAPMGALVFRDALSGLRWFVAWAAVFLGAGVIGELIGPVPALPEWFTVMMLGLNIAVSSAVVFVLMTIFVKQRFEALSALRGEQARSEDLLLNVLPRSIAEQLKWQPHTIAENIESASILFADVVDFTPFAQRLPPAEVVGTLDSLFSRFDTLAERYGLEKIKTIGDSYMVAAGVPTPRPDHARAVARMALDMLEVMHGDDSVGHAGLELRVGINSGSVIAGVIGRKRFAYDLWGDVVNTASRMESSSTPGRIQITRATYDLLRDEFECESRGKVEVKGKGEMDTWFLVAARKASTTREPEAAARASVMGQATRATTS